MKILTGSGLVVLFLILVGCRVEAPRTTVAPTDPEPSPENIQKAVDRGVEHLKSRVLTEQPGSDWKDPHGDQQTAGVRTGISALSGLTLLEAGVSPKDPAVQKVLTEVRQRGLWTTHIYSLAAVLLFLNRLNEAEHLEERDQWLLRTLVLRMARAQNPNGRWGYRVPALLPVQENYLLQCLNAGTYIPIGPVDGNPGVGDNSLTQFAILALWASRKHTPVRQPILYAAAMFHSTQAPDGSWNYRPDRGKDCLDSNTCAGLLALAMEKSLREDKEFRGFVGVTDPPANPRTKEQGDLAFSHLAKVIGLPKRQPMSGTKGSVMGANAYGDYYFLWCLARVAVVYNLDTIGDKDWYQWGSRLILKNQKSDGSWNDMHGDVPDTCFAILFLIRADLTKDLTQSLRILIPEEKGGTKGTPSSQLRDQLLSSEQSSVIKTESSAVAKPEPLAVAKTEKIDRTKLKEQLIRHEGKQKRMYLDDRGNPTIGVGFNLTRPGAKSELLALGVDDNKILTGEKALSEEQIDALLAADINRTLADCKAIFPAFRELTDSRQRALADMMFNLGKTRFAKLQAMIASVNKGDFNTAADELKKLAWYGQAKDRSQTLETMLRTGSDPILSKKPLPLEGLMAPAPR